MRKTVLLCCVSVSVLAAMARVLAQVDENPRNNPSSPPSTRSASSAIGYRGSLLVQMRVADLDRAIKFYQDVLDFDLVRRMDDLQWAELSFGLAGVHVGVGAGAEAKGSGTVSLNIGVREVDAARTLLESRGVMFTGETMTVPGKVKLADFADPDGNRIRLAQSLVTTKGK